MQRASRFLFVFREGRTRFDGCTSAANDYDYDPLGNLITKEGLTGTLGYGTNGSNVAGPHAVTSANYWIYQYDAIGNLTTATQPGVPTRTVSYSPFNTPTRIMQGLKFSTLVYGPNQDRIKHSDSNGRVTKYVGGIYEEVTMAGVIQKIHYVGDFALITQTGGVTPTTQHDYLHRDHIGSIVAISKGTIASASDISWQSNGAWGERRYNQWNGPLDNMLIPASTAKGFTDHEHLDAVGLIHMNGRVYDPELGRFMSADPFVQAPYNSQSYNRYSYVFNNPLSFTDPSGYTASCGYSACDDVEEVLVTGYGCASGATCLNGAAGYQFGQDWQNYMNRYQESMVNMGGFWGGVGYTSIGMANQLGVADALGAVDSALEGDVGGAVYGTAVTFVKPLKVAERVTDLVQDVKAAEKKVEKALDTKNTDAKGDHGNSLDTTKPAQGYSLRDRDTGGVLKYGETTRGEKRYTQKFLENANAEMIFEAKGTKREMHAWQHEKILDHKFNNDGVRPPLNKSDY